MRRVQRRPRRRRDDRLRARRSQKSSPSQRREREGTWRNSGRSCYSFYIASVDVGWSDATSDAGEVSTRTRRPRRTTKSADEEIDAGDGRKKSAVEWGIERSEAYTAMSELLQRLCDVLERANELATVEDAPSSSGGRPRRGHAGGRDGRPTREIVVDGGSRPSRPRSDARASRALARERGRGENARRVGDALRTSRLAFRRPRTPSSSLSDAPSPPRQRTNPRPMRRTLSPRRPPKCTVCISPRRSRSASMAELRATAAEEAAETVTELCADARRHADASAKLAESSRGSFNDARPSSRFARSPPRRPACRRRLAAVPRADVLGERAADRVRARALAPFPTPI